MPLNIITGGNATSHPVKGIGPIQPVPAPQSWPPKRLDVIGAGEKSVRNITTQREDAMIFDLPG